MLERLATRIDTANGRRLARLFRSGYAGRSRPDVQFHQTPLAHYRYRLRAPDAGGRGHVPTVVLLADAPVTLEQYDALLDLWGKDYRVVALEGAAMGFSAPDPAYAFGFRETNDDMARFLREVAGPGSILAFSCVAGLGAVDIAVRHPDLVSGLFLMQTADWDSMLDWKLRRDPKRLLSRPLLGQVAMKLLAPKRAPGWFKQALGRRDQMAMFCECSAEAFAHGAQFALASAFQRYLSGPSPLGTPRQPMQLLWGMLDASHRIDAAACRTMAQRLAPQAGVDLLDNVGHFPELQAPEAVLGRLNAFVARTHLRPDGADERESRGG